MNKIYRNIKETLVSAAKVNNISVDGKADLTILDPILFTGDPTDKEIQSHLREIYGDGNYHIILTGDAKLKYEMPLPEFIENATLTDRSESEEFKTIKNLGKNKDQ